MAKFAVILAAAGRSLRFGADSTRDKKTFRELSGRAVWLRAAELFHARPDVEQMILLLAPEDIEWFQEKFRPNITFMDLEIVEGGEERADSVENALSRVRSEIDFVAVHDAARPMMTADWIEDVFAAARESGAAIPASPISSTVKRVDAGVIEETVPRAGLFAAQTPQVFSREILVEAFSKRGDFQPTDEAQLVERLGHRVSVVPGSPLNIKITTQDDLKMAEALLSVLPRTRSLDSLAPGSDEKPKWLFD
jgi:2-C-methyl-D-erythritol 4-phosphate cytidylyltransferase